MGSSEPPVTSASSSSPLALARMGKRTVALLADEDERRLRLIDLEGKRELASAPLAGAPGHVIIDGAGRIYVAVRDAAHVASFEAGCAPDSQGSECSPELIERGRIPTPREPIALGLSRDGDTLLIACGWGRALLGHPIREGGGSSFTAPLAREPRGFALDKTGRYAIVAHAVGSRVSVVSLEEGSVLRERALDWRDKVLDPSTSSVLTNVPRHAVQGFAVAVIGERAHVPMVLVYPGDPLTSSGGYGLSVEEIAPYFPNEPALVVIDVPAATSGPEEAGEGQGAEPAATADVILRTPYDVISADKSRASAGRPARPKLAPCLLPRAAAVDPVRGTVLVACFDIGAVVEIGPEDGPLAKTERRRISVGKGPSAIAIDPEKREAWVWSHFDRRLAAVPLDKPQAPPRAFDLPSGAPSREEAGRRASSREEVGRRAFHEPVAFDGRSCASCHIEGRDDGLVWSSPIGLVQTPVLAGRTADTPPHGWRGENATVEAHIKRGFERLRGPKPNDETLTAMARYIATMPTYRAPSKSPLTPEEARGREIFHSPETSCSACHAGEGVWTDGIRRDVGTGGTYDTPSLRFLGDTAPYMHDGRYATLRELLIASDGKMGFTRHLDDADLSALIAYLKTM
jgi:DNA-binding beta-propeller fold protein YncE/mono/diheme cytochrome c family protein